MDPIRGGPDIVVGITRCVISPANDPDLIIESGAAELLA
jgi:hypothetical protein